MHKTGFSKMRQVFLIQISQGSLNIHITIKIDEGVFRAVIGLMEVQKVLFGKLRYSIGISAGFKAIAGIREERLHGFVF